MEGFWQTFKKVTEVKDTLRFDHKKILSVAVAAVFCAYSVSGARGYAFDEIVPDVRQPISLSGGSACPVRAHQLSTAGSVTVRWSTAPGHSVVAQAETAWPS